MYRCIALKYFKVFAQLHTKFIQCRCAECRVIFSYHQQTALHLGSVNCSIDIPTCQCDRYRCMFKSECSKADRSSGCLKVLHYSKGRFGFKTCFMFLDYYVYLISFRVFLWIKNNIFRNVLLFSLNAFESKSLFLLQSSAAVFRFHWQGENQRNYRYCILKI